MARSRIGGRALRRRSLVRLRRRRDRHPVRRQHQPARSRRELPLPAPHPPPPPPPPPPPAAASARAAGDGVIAVGAYASQRTPEAEDDQFAAFSNRGPRNSDTDDDPLDELKPDLIAPGVSVLSADGDETTDGHQYRRLSGTSMSAA